MSVFFFFLSFQVSAMSGDSPTSATSTAVAPFSSPTRSCCCSSASPASSWRSASDSTPGSVRSRCTQTWPLYSKVQNPKKIEKKIISWKHKRYMLYFWSKIYEVVIFSLFPQDWGSPTFLPAHLLVFITTWSSLGPSTTCSTRSGPSCLGQTAKTTSTRTVRMMS